MQSLPRTLLIRNRIIPAPRVALALAQTARPFSSTRIAPKSATESVKDARKTVDKAVASKIVDGIEAGQTAAQKAKAAAGLSSKEAKGKAAEANR
ncbi:hypothetical protein DID88_001784 [Monilinia fructigena]|uniref:Uncharacterized protein n=1 Tax=Monilinia fructigena TaxID=38457 RepID=A0A395IZA1_9HELO|nr:hypothetical protein DID88_001784 [Monilinia fructigena]